MRNLSINAALLGYIFCASAYGQDWVTSVKVYGVPLSCTSSIGNLVPLKVTDDAIAKGGGGYASIDPLKGASILLSPSYLEKLPRVAAFFLFYHECAHVALPFGIGLASVSQEGNADCYAVREMRKAGLINSWRTFAEAVDGIKKLPGDASHIPGPERISAAASCVGIPVVRNSNDICMVVDRVFTTGKRFFESIDDARSDIVPGFFCEAMDDKSRLFCYKYYHDEDAPLVAVASMRNELSQCVPSDFEYHANTSINSYGWRNDAKSIFVSAYHERLSLEIIP